jgi:hypothetical protein
VAIQVLVKMDTIVVVSPNVRFEPGIKGTRRQPKFLQRYKPSHTHRRRPGGVGMNIHWMRSAIRLRQTGSNQRYRDDAILGWGDSGIPSWPIGLTTVQRSPMTLYKNGVHCDISLQ